MTSLSRQLGSERTIVVGVDGSEDSTEALKWAATEAHAHGGHIRAILAWQVRPMSLIGGYVPAELQAQAEGAAKARLAQELSFLADDLADVQVSGEAIEGAPNYVLTSASEGADLLVVGTRGHGTVSSIILGSVSKHLSTHAPCPVVIVPREHRRARRPRLHAS